jgi:hypothetical protein
MHQKLLLVFWPFRFRSKQCEPLIFFSSLFKAEPVYEGRLKVILLLQVSSHDFEPTFIIFFLNWRILPDQPKQKQITKPLTRNKHLSLLQFWCTLSAHGFRFLKPGTNRARPSQPGIYRWSIILADTDFFQQSVSVSAADFRGRNNRPSAKHFFIKLSAKHFLSNK